MNELTLLSSMSLILPSTIPLKRFNIMADPPWKLTSIFPMWALQDFEEIDGRPSFCPEKKLQID